MWRLTHDELPESKPPNVVALLIGPSDLWAVQGGGEAAILAEVDPMMQR